MPCYHKVNWYDFEVEVRPKGIRRVLRFLPYITGSKPKVRVTINGHTPDLSLLEAEINSYDPNGHQREPSLIWDWPQMKYEPAWYCDHVYGDIELHPVSVSGNHRINIKLQCGIWPSSICVGDIFSFKAIAKETLMGWAAGIIVGIGAVVVGILNLIGLFS